MSKKKSTGWGIASLILGILSILTLTTSFGFPVGVAAIIFYFVQKRILKTKLALAGLITGILGAVISFRAFALYRGVKFIVIVSVVVLAYFGINKLRKRKINKKVLWKWIKWGLISLGGFILLLFIMAYISNIPKQCESKECFLGKANNCKNAYFVNNEDFGVVRYDSYFNCWVKKTIVSLDESESQEMKNLLEGKYMYCDKYAYRSSGFDDELVGDLLYMKNCEDRDEENANLLETIKKLLIFAG